MLAPLLLVVAHSSFSRSIEHPQGRQDDSLKVVASPEPNPEASYSVLSHLQMDTSLIKLSIDSPSSSTSTSTSLFYQLMNRTTLVATDILR